MATIKKPKLKKLPKKPKVTAKIDVWKNWEKKALDVQKGNKEKDKVYQSKIKAKETIKKQIAKISGIGKL